MPFNTADCLIPKIWCGKTIIPPPGYYKSGTKYECFKKGMGVGTIQEKSKNLNPNSLQNIRYVGNYYEERFKLNKIKNINELITKVSPLSSKDKETLLKKILKNSDGKVDFRSYNSVLLFLNDKRIRNLPSCKKIKI
jgi:hypothetical protein